MSPQPRLGIFLKHFIVKYEFNSLVLSSNTNIIMKGTNLGEFQELVLLTIGMLHPNAYGVAIKDELKKKTGRSVTLSTVHAALVRLEKKGLVQSEFGESTSKRGGKRKKNFTITAYGLKALRETKEQRESMWKQIPDVVFELKFH